MHWQARAVVRLVTVLVFLSLCTVAMAAEPEEPEKPLFDVFKIKHRPISEMSTALSTFLPRHVFESLETVLPGPPGTLIIQGLSPEYRPLVEQVIALFDVPPVTYEVRARLIHAYSADASPKAGHGVAEELDDEVGELLSSVFKFAGYKLLDDVVIRANTEETVIAPVAYGRYTLQVQARYQTPEEGPADEGIFAFDQFVLIGIGKGAGLQTSFRVRSGNPVVVGACRIEDSPEALIIILTATPAPGLPLPQDPEKSAQAR